MQHAAAVLVALFLLAAPALPAWVQDVPQDGPDDTTGERLPDDPADEAPDVPFHPLVQDAFTRVSLSRIAAHVQYLGQDSLRGRAPGTPGGDRAAAYIAEQLEAAGLHPAGPGGGYFQPVPLHGSRPQSDCRLEIILPDTVLSLELWEDYLLYATGAHTLVERPAPLVFAGYGIVAPEYDYDDYQGIDVRGAIVVLLSGEPVSKDPSYFEGAQETPHASPGVKQRLALSRGALGSILIPAPGGSGEKDWTRLRRDFRFEHVTLAYGVSENLSLLLNPERAGALFRGADSDYGEICSMDSLGAMHSFPMAGRASFRGVFHERDFISPNVAGIIPGHDPLLEDTYLVICAHYDHLGVGFPVEGDSIYNGVIDNASGVGAVLEMARVFASTEARPNRSILFLLLTAEETGLLGARYYCDHPLVPLHRTAAALNVDGLAFLDTFDDVVGIGSEYSTLREELGRAASLLNLRVTDLPLGRVTEDEFPNSDQYAFALHGVPSVLVQEGLSFRHHGKEEGLRRMYLWGRDIYHSPFDDLTQPVNADALWQHVQLLTAFAGALATTYIEPQWLPGSPYAVARLQTLAEGR